MSDLPSLPSGTVAFLFTDIDGSTRRWQQDPAAMASAVDQHLVLLRAAATTHHGVMFKVIGDGTQSAFRTVPDAIAAAVDAQRALRSQTWSPTISSLPVRMAIHLGAAEARDGDYLAPCLNRLSRLLDVGYGGQVLMSEAASDMAREALPIGMQIRDLGLHRLRDLTDAEHIFQLVSPELPSDFPPLRTLDNAPNNLPVQPTTFIGREHEVRHLVGLLGTSGIRLLTLTGPPGVGKTRLALQVAAELVDVFPDGVYFVALAPLNDAALAPAAMSSALNVAEEPNRPLMDTLRAHLADEHLLLVLDNFEHLLAAATLVSDLLAAAPRIAILVTSRAPLRLRGEREFAVPAMSVPNSVVASPDDLVHDYDAVRLFVTRARDVDEGFRLESSSALDVVAICRQLDGLPLAIELAAARTKLLPPAALLDRLGHRLRLLGSGPRDAPSRQRTLRDTIAWSYDLLRPEEHRLFRRLAIFPAGWTLDAAEAVADDDHQLGIDLLDGLASLIDQSLVLREEAGGRADHSPRYMMLQTIREFGLERLDAAGEKKRTDEALRTFLLDLLDKAEQGLGGPEQSAWLDRLEAEHDTFRHALADALQRPESALALQLSIGLWRFWLTRGHTSEGRAWLERALQHDVSAPAELQGRARQSLGHLAFDLGNYGEAEHQFTTSLDRCRAGGDRRGIAESLGGLAVVALNRQQYAKARTLLEEALSIHRSLSDERGVATSLYLLAIVARERGDQLAAGKLFEEALGFWRREGDSAKIGQTLLGLGMVRRFEGQASSARRLVEEARAILERIGYQYWVAATSMQLGHIARMEGDDHQAVQHYIDSLTRALTVGANEMTVENLEFLACVATTLGQPLRAARLFGAAASLRTHFELPPPMDSEAVALNRCLEEAQLAAGKAWAAAWSAGQELTLDQAVAEATSVTEQSSG